MNMRWLAFAAVTTAATLGVSTLLYAQSAAQVSSWSGVYSADQAAHGRQLFDDNCAKCHQSTLDGSDEIPPLKGSHFMADWEQQSVNDLMERVHTTMPLDDPGKLNTQSSTDVVAYLLQQNGMPAGNAPMAPGLLTTIRIDPNKPGT
jgi:S-disulfanyl-L-cysteine oxidoreductase SoxD